MGLSALHRSVVTTIGYSTFAGGLPSARQDRKAVVQNLGALRPLHKCTVQASESTDSVLGVQYEITIKMIVSR